MKRLLAVSLTLVMVFGLVAVGSAAELERMGVANMNEAREAHAGAPISRDYCEIWMDEALSGWITAWYGGLEPGCAYKKFIDPFFPLDPTRPEMEISDCILDEPFWPFHVTSFHMYAHTFEMTEVSDVTLEWDLEYPVWEPDPNGSGCEYYPGPTVWSQQVTYTLQPSSWYHISYTLDTTAVPAENVVMDAPFMVSVHCVDVFPAGGILGIVTDTCVVTGAVPCWNWYELGCIGYPGWYESDIAYGPFTNLILWVDGFPDWQVPVEMGIFEAIPGDKMVRLNWQSMSETNNAYWIVSRDGEQLAQIEGQGNKESATDYQYVDRNVVNGETYSYTLEAINYEGTGVTYGPVVATAVTVPLNYELSQNYPNPFNASTVIRYDLAAGENVTLKVYNINGQEVASLVDEYQKAGHYSVTWSGKGISSGVYMYTLTAGDFSETKKMVYTK
jgi:hypothetical protein